MEESDTIIGGVDNETVRNEEKYITMVKTLKIFVGQVKTFVRISLPLFIYPSNQLFCV